MATTEMAAHVIAGEIIVNEIDCALSEPDFAVFYIDCMSKYAEVLATGFSEEGGEIVLFASERSLHADETKKGMPTVIHFVTDGVWDIMADAGRYTVRVVMFRTGSDFETIWRTAE